MQFLDCYYYSVRPPPPKADAADGAEEEELKRGESGTGEGRGTVSARYTAELLLT